MHKHGNNSSQRTKKALKLNSFQLDKLKSKKLNEKKMYETNSGNTTEQMKNTHTQLLTFNLSIKVGVIQRKERKEEKKLNLTKQLCT